jgi:hypothetical protein
MCKGIQIAIKVNKTGDKRLGRKKKNKIKNN